MLPDFLNLLASLTYDLLKSLLPAAPRQEEIAALTREIHDLHDLLARFGAPTVLRVEGDVTHSVIVLGDGNRLTLADDGSLSRRWQDWLAQGGSLDEARALYQAHLAAAYERHTFPLTGLSFSVFIGAIYRPPRLVPSDRPWQRPVRAADAPLDLRGLLSQPHPVAVTAPLGEGKTTTLRYLTWAYAAPSEERFLPGMGEWLPIPLTIPRLVALPPADGDPLEGWARLVCGAFSTLQPALVERVLRAAVQDGTALLLLDALDEAPLSAAERAEFLAGLHRLWQGEHWKGNRLLLTSRPRALPESDFSTFSIQPMRPADLSDLAYHLGKALLRQLAEEGLLSLSQSESDSLLEELLRLVERLPRAGLSSPFYATLLTVGVLRARSAAGGLKQAESIRQPARLYRFFIAQTLEWERDKPNAPASLPDLETALRALAQIAWGTLGDAELRQSLPLSPLPAADLAAALTFWERSGLLCRDPLSLEWEFVHRGFEQFGRALYLHAAWQQPALALQVEALQRATLGQEEWDEVWEMVYGL
jgi:hypothetical protein